ncbi:unnamed protein product [Schistosoma bovis]|nr:unnamed protein product [Schistosoma bovis]
MDHNEKTINNSESIHYVTNYVTFPSIKDPIYHTSQQNNYIHNNNDYYHNLHHHDHHDHHLHHHYEHNHLDPSQQRHHSSCNNQLQQPYIHYTIDTDEHLFPINDTSSMTTTNNTTSYMEDINDNELSFNHNVTNVSATATATAAAVAAAAAAAAAAASAVAVTTGVVVTLHNTDYSINSYIHQPNLSSSSNYNYYQYYLNDPQYQHHHESIDLFTLHPNHPIQQQQQQQQQDIEDVNNRIDTTITPTTSNNNHCSNDPLKATTKHTIRHSNDNRMKSQAKLSISDDNDDDADEDVKGRNQNILKSGMLCLICEDKATAVQKERDKISNRHTTYDPNSSIHSSIDLQKLLQAEAIANCAIHQNYINITKRSSDLYNEQSNYKELHENNLANINDICESIRTQLIFLIEWAKNLSVFTSLTISDQIALLQAHAGEMLILGAIWRSITLGPTLNKSNEYKIEKSKYFEQKTNQNDNISINDTIDDITITLDSNIVAMVTTTTTTATTTTTTMTTTLTNSWNTTVTTTTTTTTPTTNNGNSNNNGDQSIQKNQIIDNTIDTTYLQSINYEPQFILLGNNRIISRQNPLPEIADLANMIINEIYQPIQNLCLDEIEIVCFRAIMFFDPSCESLSENGRLLIRSCQYLIQMELMNIMNGKLYLPQGRFGALLLLIPEFRSVTYQMIHKLQIIHQMGFTKLDGLLSEILLNNTIHESNGNIESSQVKSSMKHSVNKYIVHEENNKSPTIYSMPKLYSTHNDDIYTSQITVTSTSFTSSFSSSASSASSASSISSSGSSLSLSTVSSMTHINNNIPIIHEIDDTINEQLTNINHYLPINSSTITTQLHKMYPTTIDTTISMIKQTNIETNSFNDLIIQSELESIPSIHVSNVLDYYYDNNNINHNHNCITEKQSNIDTLTQYYQAVQPIMSTVKKFSANFDISSHSNNNHHNVNNNDVNQSLITMHLGEETFENISNSDYSINSNIIHCLPNLEPGMYYSDDQFYTTYSHHLNMIKAKYNQNTTINTTNTTTTTHDNNNSSPIYTSYDGKHLTPIDHSNSSYSTNHF